MKPPAFVMLPLLRGRSQKVLSVVSIVGFLLLWHARVTGKLSWSALASLTVFVFVCLAFGRAFLSVSAGLLKSPISLAFQFLCGFIIFNTLLFVVSLVSPLGMLINVSLLSLASLGLLLPNMNHQPAIDSVQDELPSLICILVSGVAATLWCLDAQAELLIQGQTAIYQTWQDTFIHVREISIFSQAHGLSTIRDVGMSEVPAPIYHFASYISAAAVSAVTGTPAINVYSSFQLPIGIFLTGLAAFSLAASIWGGWPALAAVVAVVLLPDAYQQGFANRYLSYNFLAQINLGMLYGIACAALAWIFMLAACRTGKIAAVLVGYMFLGVCLFYKAHIFVANAYLILIYPCLFFPGIKPHWRMVFGFTLTALFLSVIALSQNMARVPVLRLDGSGIGQYILVLLNTFDAGILKTFFTQIFINENHSKPVQAMYATFLLVLSTFGMWVVATPLVVLIAERRLALAVLFFPALVVVNYLAMSIGLAMDTRGIGTADELLNRPLVWAYFVVAAWTAGAGYFLAIGNRLPKSRMTQASLLAFVCASLISPLYFSQNVQTFPTKKGFANYEEFNSVPLCVVRAAEYIRDNSRLEDIMQDSENDPRFAVTALAERQRFAGVNLFAQPTIQSQKRLDSLAEFKLMQSGDDMRSYARFYNITWYLLHPSTDVAWPRSFLEHSEFDCGGYRVYRIKQ